ncbi:MAG: Crp/Fnr family transcriptional regulator [Paenibacillus sp.]|nr:Crp/Fnr family transcriptional regulator [Paenibacillus sp.]
MTVQSVNDTQQSMHEQTHNDAHDHAHKEGAPCGGSKSALSEPHFAALRKRMTIQAYPAHSKLFSEGDEAGKLYYIMSGRIETKKTYKDGSELTLPALVQGDLLGEFDVYGTMTHSFTAEVAADAEVGEIAERELDMYLRQDGEFADAFMKWAGLFSRDVQPKLRELALLGKPSALASAIIRSGESYETNGGILKRAGVAAVSGSRIVLRRMEEQRVCSCPTCPRAAARM